MCVFNNTPNGKFGSYYQTVNTLWFLIFRLCSTINTAANYLINNELGKNRQRACISMRIRVL